MNTGELFAGIDGIAAEYATFAPRLNTEEKHAAVEVGRKIGSRMLLRLWKAYCSAKPAKRFAFFLQDRAEEIRDAEPPKTPTLYTCSGCKRQVTDALFFRDSGRCTDCERRAVGVTDVDGVIAQVAADRAFSSQHRERDELDHERFREQLNRLGAAIHEQSDEREGAAV